MLSSCPLWTCHARLLARSGHWQRGRRPRWRLRRPLALALACDSLEPGGSPIARVCSLASPGRHVPVRFAQKASSPRGGASFCAERKIPANLAGTADKSMQGLREQMPRRPEERLHWQDRAHKVGASRRAEKCRSLRVNLKVELRCVGVCGPGSAAH